MPRHGDNYWLERIATVGLPGGGAGTQYADGAARSTATGTLGMVDDGANIQSMAGDTAGNTKIVGNTGDATTDSGNPVKVGAVYTATAPTYTDGQRANLQIGSRGALRVELIGQGSTTGASAVLSGADATSNSTTGLNMYTLPRVFNGTTWDRLRGSTTGLNTRATTTQSTISASGAKTTTGNSSSIAVGDYRNALITLNCTAASGTTPTLNVKIQASDDGGTTWYDLPSAAFTQLTTTGSQAIAIGGNTSSFGDTIRASWTIAGTTPSFTFAVKAVLKT